MNVHVVLDHEPVADGGFLVHALLRVEGDRTAPEERTPLNLGVVLDRSGSMTGEKLTAAKAAAVRLVQRLWPEDRVSVVVFDHEVDVVAPPTFGAGHLAVADRIRRVRAGGSTNLSGGWLRGRDLVAEASDGPGVHRVILLTDGLANVGITDPEALMGLCRKAAEAGITTTTIGFGEGFDEELLRGMADAGGGGTYYIEEPDQAAGVFNDELEGLMSLAAQNVRVRVTPGEGPDEVRVLHDYPSHAAGEVLTVELGDLYGVEPRRLLLRFLVPPLEGDADPRVPVELAQVEVVGHVLTGKDGVERKTIALPITFSPADGPVTHPEVRREILLVEAARARTEALKEAREGDRYAAAARLREAAEQIRGSGLEDDEILAEECADLVAMADTVEIRVLHAADGKYLQQRAYSSMRSRHRTKKSYRRGEGEPEGK